MWDAQRVVPAHEHTRHIDQIVICLAQHCPKMERLEVQWDPDTIRYSDNSSKFIDQLRYGNCRIFTVRKYNVVEINIRIMLHRTAFQKRAKFNRQKLFSSVEQAAV